MAFAALTLTQTWEPPDSSPLWDAGFAGWARRSNAFEQGRYNDVHARPGRAGTSNSGPLRVSTSGHFHLLATKADCCRWNKSADLSILGQSYHAYGTVLGGLTAQDLKEGGVRTGPKLERVSAPAGCEEACLSTRRCTFFSHSTALRTCVFCSTCALTSDGPGTRFTAWARSQIVPRRSPFPWAASLLAHKSTATRDKYQEVAATYDDLLGPLLQGNYSQTVYGAPGRVPLHDLRVVWLDLLPKRSLRRLSQVGMCKWEAKPPFQPFYFVQDMHAGPVDAMWLSRFPPEVPLASHTWVEVAHCPNRRATSGRRRLERQPLMNWKFRPMWFYLAPGSGVSINLGRTVAVRSYDAAVWLLRRMFPRSVPPNISCAQLSTLARRTAGTEASRPGTTTPTPTYGIEDVVHGDIDLRPVDSIQILSHRAPASRACAIRRSAACLPCFRTREQPRQATNVHHPQVSISRGRASSRSFYWNRVPSACSSRPLCRRCVAGATRTSRAITGLPQLTD